MKRNPVWEKPEEVERCPFCDRPLGERGARGKKKQTCGNWRCREQYRNREKKNG